MCRVSHRARWEGRSATRGLGCGWASPRLQGCQVGREGECRVIAKIFVDEDGRLRSGWRFLIAFIVVVFSFTLSEGVGRALSKNVAIQNTVNRPISTLIMLVVFLLMGR